MFLERKTKKQMVQKFIAIFPDRHYYFNVSARTSIYICKSNRAFTTLALFQQNIIVELQFFHWILIKKFKYKSKLLVKTILQKIYLNSNKEMSYILLKFKYRNFLKTNFNHGDWQ